jgi:hypothetical protein
MDSTVRFIVVYLVFHFCAYNFTLSFLPAFRPEPAMFLAHAVSLVLLVGLVTMETVVWRLGRSLAAPHSALALNLYGIYSRSFLELWSFTPHSGASRHRSWFPIWGTAPIKMWSRSRTR